MKTILLVTVFLASLAPAFSQTQEVKLVDRIMKPDMQLGNPLQGRSFAGTESVPIRKSPQGLKSFYGVKDANTKDFQFTRSFLGLKNPWIGGKVYETRQASALSKYDVKQAGFNRTTEVDSYYKATKEANLGSPVVPVPTFFPQAAAGGAVGRISDKINQKMTIDEVRELLNKPR